MRQRWDIYQITIDDPVTGSSMLVGSGMSEDLTPGVPTDYRQALGVIVGAIRTAARRTACTHDAGRGSRYCPVCGQALIDPALPDVDDGAAGG